MDSPVALKALVFDAYGTLFDVHSVIAECEALFPGQGGSLSRLWRTKQLEYTWLRSLMGRYADFSAITRAALITACNTLRLQLTGASTGRLMDAYLMLKAFPDVAETLTSFNDCKLAILSNGSPAMLNSVVRHNGLDRLFDAVLSVDALRIFKPHPSVYAYAADRLQTPPGAIGFVSSNFWDVAGATSFGFRAFWINRSGSVPDDLDCQPAAVLPGLTGLPALLKSRSGQPAA
ncbi:MAG TPA: haloacid dehalogenase type II [Burkholderiales bacterium]|nr:haloacid dehalogenase type II [Burkholderiales bacterium]